MSRVPPDSKQGSAWLRWGAEPGRADRQAVPGLRRHLRGIAKRRGKKIATIAIARKLLTRAYHLFASMQATTASTPAASAASAAAAPKTGRLPSSGHVRPAA